MAQAATLDIVHVIFVDASRTADYQMTVALRQILHSDGNEDDILAQFAQANLQVDDIAATAMAEELLAKGDIELGYLTISNALQWRLQYRRVINFAGQVEGVERVR